MSKFAPFLCLTFLSLLFTSCHSMKVRKLNSIEQVETLKDGALLVRLKTSQSKIDKLLELGRSMAAEQVVKTQFADNQNIIQAFKNGYEFCPVYFFLSGNSNKVRNGDLKNIFLNEELEIDTSIQYSGDFLTAEFGNNQGSPTKDVDGNLTPSTSSYGLNALIVMDKNFVQLSKPFPSMVQVEINDDAQIKYEAVKNLNQNIGYFFYDGRKWKAKKLLVDFK